MRKLTVKLWKYYLNLQKLYTLCEMDNRFEGVKMKEEKKKWSTQPMKKDAKSYNKIVKKPS